MAASNRLLWAVLSAAFAAMTAMFAKVGVHGVGRISRRCSARC